MRKRNKAKLEKCEKVILKANLTTKYIKYKRKNAGTSSCKSIRISKLQCLNSSTKY